MAKFTKKESRIARILLELVDLIPRFDRRNPKPIFPSWSTRRKRYFTGRSRFAGSRVSLPRSNCFFFSPNCDASTSSDSPLIRPPTAEIPSKRRENGVLIDLNKNPEEVLNSEDLNPSPAEKPFRLDEGFKDGIFMDMNRNSEEGVPLDGDKLKVEIIMEVQCCRPTVGKKRGREESMISWTKEKRGRVGSFSFRDL